jgi:hypothetical protein
MMTRNYVSSELRRIRETQLLDSMKKESSEEDKEVASPLQVETELMAREVKVVRETQVMVKVRVKEVKGVKEVKVARVARVAKGAKVVKVE